MSGTSAHLRACMSAWLSDELRAPDLALRLVLRRRARDFGAESGPREYLEAFALKALASAPKDTSSAETLEPLLQDAIAWALEAAEITRDVQQPSSSQKDFGVESLVMLGRVVQEAFRLGAADDERVAHALWWKLHLLADTDRSRFWHWKGRVREVRPGLSREAAHARRDALRGQLEPWCLRASEALHAALVPSMDRLRTRLAASGYDNAEHGARGEHSVVARGHRDAPAPHVLLEVPDPISKRSGKVSSWAIRNSYPDAVANHLAYLLARGALPNDLILLMPPDAPAHAWADYARALTRAGIPFSAPWGPAWQEMLVVRAWAHVLAFSQAPDDPFARYALLVGPSFGAPDTLQVDAIDDDMKCALHDLVAASEHGAVALFDAWVRHAPISIAIEHLRGAAWLREVLRWLRSHVVNSAAAHGDTPAACAADLSAGLRRVWPDECAPSLVGAVRLRPRQGFAPNATQTVFLCEPTMREPGPSWQPVSEPRAWVVASVQATPVDGWGAAHAHGPLLALVQAARASGNTTDLARRGSLGDLAHAELLRTH